MAKTVGFGAKAKINHTVVTYRLTALTIKHLSLSLNFATLYKSHLHNLNNKHSVQCPFSFQKELKQYIYKSTRATQNTASKNYVKSKSFSLCSHVPMLRGITASELEPPFIHSFIHTLLFSFSLSLLAPPSCLSSFSSIY